MINPTSLDAFAAIPNSLLDKSDTGESNELTEKSEAEKLFETGKHTEQFNANNNAQSDGDKANVNLGSQSSQKKKISDLTGEKGGKIATDLMNYILPGLFYMISKKLGYDVKKEQLKLNAEERELLIPAWQNVLDNTFIDLNNPWYALAFVCAIVYGGKMMYEIPDIKKSEPVKKDYVETMKESVKESTEKNKGKEPAFNIQAEYEKKLNEMIREVRNKRRKGDVDAEKWIKKMGMDVRLMQDLQREAYDNNNSNR